MKKILISLITMIILTNFIFSNISYADDATSNTSNTITPEEYSKIANDGKVDLAGNEVTIGDVLGSTISWPIAIIVNFVNIFTFSAHFWATMIIDCAGILEENSAEETYTLFTIQNILVGKYALFDANIFIDLYQESGNILSEDNFMIKLRDNIKLWFVITRDIAIVMNLCTLVYIAVRMAISTIASDRAKYKEMLYNWVVSMAIIFFLPYIMAAICFGADILINIARNLMNALGKSFETQLMTELFKKLKSLNGFDVAFYAIIYWMLLWNEIKFFMRYAKRTLTVFFLVMIAPLITITYSIDKLADKKAQVFDKWLHEYILNVFIQPIHCFTYLVFMFIANDIFINSPIIGIIFLNALTKSEKIILSILGLSGVSLKQVGDEMNLKGFSGKLKGLVPKSKS